MLGEEKKQTNVFLDPCVLTEAKKSPKEDLLSPTDKTQHGFCVQMPGPVGFVPQQVVAGIGA